MDYKFKTKNLYDNLEKFLNNWRSQGDLKHDIVDMRQRLKMILNKHEYCQGGCNRCDEFNGIKIKNKRKR